MAAPSKPESTRTRSGRLDTARARGSNRLRNPGFRWPSAGCPDAIPDPGSSLPPPGVRRRCVAVEAHVGAAHALLGGAAVVEREDIEVQSQMAGGQGREGGLGTAQQPLVGLIQGGERGFTRIRQRMDALAQGRRRGYGHQAQWLPLIRGSWMER